MNSMSPKVGTAVNKMQHNLHLKDRVTVCHNLHSVDYKKKSNDDWRAQLTVVAARDES